MHITCQRPCQPRLRSRRRSRGVAAVEAAITLPVIIVLVLGVIETTNMIFMRQALVAAAYESGRIAIRRDGTATAANARGQQVLNARGINDAVFTFTPSNVEDVERGQPVSINVTAPTATHAYLPLRYYDGLVLSVDLTYVKE